MLVIAGTLTNVCCEGTARDGNLQGYKVIAVAAGSQAHGKFEVKDQLVKLNGKPLSGGGPFVTQFGAIAVGGKAKIELVRKKVA